MLPLADPHARARAAASSDALVLFGGTGDLARKKIYPALLAMARDGYLDVPVIVVAHRDLRVDELRRYVHDSLCQHGSMDEAAFPKLARLIECVHGDYRDPATFVD